jgi:gas vesicle protein GvpL/GvpF
MTRRDDRRSTMADRRSATYVFCLAQSNRPPSLRGVPESVPGAGPARLIRVDRDVWAVVADAPLERFGSEQLQKDLQDVEAISRHALAHASVVEYVFRRAPVIPLKLFTLFSSDEVALAQLRTRRVRLRQMLTGLRGLEEWGVRIVAGEADADAARTLTSGRDYLQAKKRLHEQAVAPPRATVRAVNRALASLEKTAAKSRKDVFPPPGKGRPYVTGASFLVNARRRDAWKARVGKTTTELARQGHRLEMSGPWPPYHFVSR